MLLVSIKQYLLRNFADGSALHENTVRRLIREHKIPGRRIGSRYFVDESAGTSKVDALIARVVGHVRSAS